VGKNRKMGDLSDFERGQIIGARLAGAYVTKTASFSAASRATASKVMSAYRNIGRQHQRRGTAGQNQY
jgi:hypothetical protein